jgi:FtsP/CotA-like multicopper oxidase with cupredoxin domain
MTHTFTRRGFLAAGAALSAAPLLTRAAFAQTSVLSLTAATRTLEVNGRAATVYGLSNATGGAGLILDPGQRFRVDLTNALDTETLIHWHGQIPPNLQDGVPDMPMAKLAPAEMRSYDFEPKPGTHWMHSHIPVQEMQLLAAPLIVRAAADVADDRQEVVMFLHDFSFKSPEEVLAQITGGASGPDGMAGMAHGSSDMGAMTMDGASDSGSGMSGMNMGGMAMGGMAMDLNDFDFDAYLVNDRTLADPQVVLVEAGGRVRLRIINAAAATTFWIDTGAVEGALVAVDGHDILPVKGRRFGIAMAQRLDILLDLPKGQGTFPVLALREGARERTGLILATSAAKVAKIAETGEASPAFDLDLAQELSLRARAPLEDRAVAKAEMVMLAGAMSPYLWTINGQTWENHQPVTAKSGDRVELTFHNMSMMGHPMHLHGHAFQVVAINAQRFAGAVRDTVYVPPMAQVTIAIDAGEAARWMLHCHHMPHLATGMMTEFHVTPRGA